MATQLFNLEGKIALITGASRGIGEATAHLLAEQGAHVIVSSRKIEGCESVAQAITDKGHSAEAFACNIGNMDDIAAIFEHIKNTHGRIDILVNNAATSPYFGDILDTDLRAFTKTLDVNVRGYFYMSVEASKLMRDTQSGGAIVNTASINALQPGVHQAIYSITKAAVVNMTKCFAKECAQHNIRCNALVPGFTKTNFSGVLFTSDELYEQATRDIRLGRHAEPSEMAGAILYLVSDASSFTTGESLVVDGGQTI